MASWLDTRPKAEAAVLKALFDKYVDPLFHDEDDGKPVMGGAPWEHVSRYFAR